MKIAINSIPHPWLFINFLTFPWQILDSQTLPSLPDSWSLSLHYSWTDPCSAKAALHCSVLHKSQSASKSHNISLPAMQLVQILDLSLQRTHKHTDIYVSLKTDLSCFSWNLSHKWPTLIISENHYLVWATKYRFSFLLNLSASALTGKKQHMETYLFSQCRFFIAKKHKDIVKLSFVHSWIILQLQNDQMYTGIINTNRKDSSVSSHVIHRCSTSSKSIIMLVVMTK